MTPGTLALALYRGDTHRWRFTCWADEGRTQPADLTGATAAAQLRRGAALVGTMACTVTPPNVIDATLSAALTAAVPASGVTWDLQLVYASGDVQTALAGPVVVRGDVTLAAPTTMARRSA